jgi:hypothetical protein
VTVYNACQGPLLAFTNRGQFDIQLWRKTGMFNSSPQMRDRKPVRVRELFPSFSFTRGRATQGFQRTDSRRKPVLSFSDALLSQCRYCWHPTAQ